jgi:hypothetical protein
MTEPTFDGCVAACHACADACERCVAGSLRADEVRPLARCIALAIDAAQACRVAASFITRASDIAADVCLLAAEACERCAEQCARHPAEHCRACAAACRCCAQECRAAARTCAQRQVRTA